MTQQLHDKAHNHTLYACDELDCSVCTFIDGPLCPSCEKTGRGLRYPVVSKTGQRKDPAQEES